MRIEHLSSCYFHGQNKEAKDKYRNHKWAKTKLEFTQEGEEWKGTMSNYIIKEAEELNASQWLSM